MLVDFLDPCPTCDGMAEVVHDIDCDGCANGEDHAEPCPDCVGGLVVSEDDIEKCADAIADLPYDTLELRNWGEESVADPYRIVARAAVTTLVERWRTK